MRYVPRFQDETKLLLFGRGAPLEKFTSGLFLVDHAIGFK